MLLLITFSNSFRSISDDTIIESNLGRKEKQNNTKMENGEASEEVNGRPRDAFGNISIVYDSSKTEGQKVIDQNFGILIKKTNVVIKFRVILSDHGEGMFNFKLIYPGEDTIDCDVKLKIFPSLAIKVWDNSKANK